jgi:hypothetical protein
VGVPVVRGEAVHVEIANNVYSMCDANGPEMEVRGGMQVGADVEGASGVEGRSAAAIYR